MKPLFSLSLYLTSLAKQYIAATWSSGAVSNPTEPQQVMHSKLAVAFIHVASCSCGIAGPQDLAAKELVVGSRSVLPEERML
jgi:hypothetical protein